MFIFNRFANETKCLLFYPIQVVQVFKKIIYIHVELIERLEQFEHVERTEHKKTLPGITPDNAQNHI